MEVYAANVQWVADRLPLLVHFCQHILCCQSKEVNCLYFQCIFVLFIWYIFNLEPLYIQPFLIFLNLSLVIFFSFFFCVSNQYPTTPTICISIQPASCTAKHLKTLLKLRVLGLLYTFMHVRNGLYFFFYVELTVYVCI